MVAGEVAYIGDAALEVSMGIEYCILFGMQGTNAVPFVHQATGLEAIRASRWGSIITEAPKHMVVWAYNNASHLGPRTRGPPGRQQAHLGPQFDPRKSRFTC